MKRAAIIALVCLNAVLLALVVGETLPQAKAQGTFGPDYLMVTGAMPGAANAEAVYVVDLARERLAAFRFVRQDMRLYPIGLRNLANDFRGGPRP